jgi:threonine dehydrogenase-like Zn-dependent dehydrogenase
MGRHPGALLIQRRRRASPLPATAAITTCTAVPPTMLAAQLFEPRRFQVNRVPRPEPGPGEVLIAVEGCGICGSNLPPYAGRAWFQYPFPPGSPGHEGWGRVERVGAGVSELVPGDRVAFLSSRALAEYDVAASGSAVRLPPALEGQPFPGEAIGCAVNVVRRSDLRSGQTVAVLGIGFLGAIIVRLAKLAGARVIALGRRPFALDLARRFGADETLVLDDHRRLVEAIGALTGGGLCDRVIEVVGAQGPLDLAAALTRERGRLVIAGYHQDSPRQVDMQLWNWRGLDVINAHERDPAVYVEGIRAAADLVASGRLALEPLYTRFPLDQVGAAFAALEERPDGFLKAVVLP